MSIESLFQQDFTCIPDLIRAHAQERPRHRALVHEGRAMDYATLDATMDRVGAALRRDGVQPGEVIAICATASIEYGATFLGAVRAGVAVAPLAPSASADSLLTMLRDCGARVLFLDEAVRHTFSAMEAPADITRVALDGSHAGHAFSEWLPGTTAAMPAVTIDPDAPFNIIYSSGTTGTPKGIVQSYRMRWAHVRRADGWGYDRHAITICSTPLYSNTTLVSFFPALAGGGTVVLMSKFDAARFLALAESVRATHAMLVPVQYQRIMDLPDFERYDLTSFRMKFCTSAPFSAALKADILKRWPGGLVEFYGMTEGGGTCFLRAHERPDKLHTVGQPGEEHDIRLIDDEGREVARGMAGEVVGRSAAMMNGYHNQPDKTREAEWHNERGERFIRTGDVGRFDDDGFLILTDRKKDVIISGGFNIYPSDLEAVLRQHDAVLEAAVVGVPSRQWGETPVAFVVLRPERKMEGDEIRAWANERLGKTQRMSAVEIVDALPRSPIGKVLKRELRVWYSASVATS